MTPEEFADRISHGSQILKDFARAKLNPAYSAGRKEWPRRLRNISVGEMCKAISGSKRGFMVQHVMSSIPNSFAHSGPFAMKHFFSFDERGRPSFEDWTFKSKLYGPSFLRGLTASVVLTACKDIVDSFHLSSDLRERLFKLGRRVMPTQFKDGD